MDNNAKPAAPGILRSNAMKKKVKFRRAATEQEIEELKQVFSLIDTNNSGDISKDELEDLMRLIGYNPTVEEVDMIMEEVDLDLNGSIDLQEFISILSKSEVETKYSAKEFMEAIEGFKRESSDLLKGRISCEDVENAFKVFGGDLYTEEKIKDIVKLLAGKENNCFIDYLEIFNQMNAEVI